MAEKVDNLIDLNVSFKSENSRKEVKKDSAPPINPLLSLCCDLPPMNNPFDEVSEKGEIISGQKNNINKNN